ncbi:MULTISPECIES: hypothetical protein [unclassified Moraxella]|uniref:hypothetical protein n=1 Tax=unclassified Moraxella TaxID=2685852 RepID=UPI003AF454C3
MLNVNISNTKQITIPNAILQSAHILPTDNLEIRYQEGVIMLVRQSTQATKKSLLDFAGATKGLYGNTTEERQAYLKNERDSWD